MSKTSIIVIVVTIFAALLFAASFFGSNSFVLNENRLTDPVEDPIDVSLGLANRWLDNIKATTSTPLPSFLTAEANVSAQTKAELELAVDESIDPLLCQTTTPGRVGAKSIYVTDTEAQVMILARGIDKNPNLAVYTLTLGDEAWLISDISCSAGEGGMQTDEYTFVQTGRLAQASVPEPYNSSVWHVLFTGETDSVKIVPLMFDQTSQCGSASAYTTCDTSRFAEGGLVRVQADMTEEGAMVRRLEIE